MPATRHDLPPDLGSSKKSITVSLVYVRGTDTYEIKQITNNAFYKPGDWLDEKVVGKLAEQPNWTLSAVEPDYLSFLSKLPLPFPL